MKISIHLNVAIFQLNILCIILSIIIFFQIVWLHETVNLWVLYLTFYYNISTCILMHGLLDLLKFKIYHKRDQTWALNLPFIWSLFDLSDGPWPYGTCKWCPPKEQEECLDTVGRSSRYKLIHDIRRLVQLIMRRLIITQTKHFLAHMRRSLKWALPISHFVRRRWRRSSAVAAFVVINFSLKRLLLLQFSSDFDQTWYI